jgi:hypothetical protein
MSIKRISTSAAALLVLCGAPSSAQAPQNPATNQKATPDSAVTTITGCVQKESAVLKRNPAAGNIGMDDEFVLTSSVLNPTAENQKPGATEKPDAVGTSGAASNFGRVFRVTGDKEKELKSYVGQRVEITGSLKNKEDNVDKMSSMGAGGNSELTPANTPEVTIATITTTSGSCAPVK